MERDREKQINILECTLRDGSYAVDFKFTLNDTARLARALSKIGLKYIEVGHGLGLGASRAGRGHAPWKDEDAIKVAKEAVGAGSLVGVFCIPGIANIEEIKRASDSGLDFIRIGQDATAIEESIPYLKESRRTGIYTMVNLMKSYVLSPRELGEKARILASAGAEVVYVVDSAGGMFPENVREYFEALKKNLPPEMCMGFHGHNNLALAVANCLEAVKHGAVFVDTTLFGLGRSAGNAPTEVISAVLQKSGFDIGGIDPFEIMDLVESCVEPMARRIPMYNMLSVAAGYSFFHSSFLPRAAKAAEKYGVDIKRLIAVIGSQGDCNCSDENLALCAGRLLQSKHKDANLSFIGFEGPGKGADKITIARGTIKPFIEELEILASKISGFSVLDIKPLSLQGDDTVLTEFLLHDDKTVIGRIYYSSGEALGHIVNEAKGKIKRLIIDRDNLYWMKPEELFGILNTKWGDNGITSYSYSRLLSAYAVNAVLNTANPAVKKLVIYGRNNASENVLASLRPWFEEACFFDEVVDCIGGIVLVFSAFSAADLEHLIDRTGHGGTIILLTRTKIGKSGRMKALANGVNILEIDPMGCYKALLAQIPVFERGVEPDDAQI